MAEKKSTAIFGQNSVMAFGLAATCVVFLHKTTDIEPLTGAAMVAFWCFAVAMPPLLASGYLFQRFPLSDHFSSRYLDLAAALLAGGGIITSAGICSFMWHFSYVPAVLFILFILLLAALLAPIIVSLD